MTDNVHIKVLTPATASKWGSLCGFEGVAANKRDLYSKGVGNRIAWYSRHYQEGLRIAVCVTAGDKRTGLVEYVPGEHCWRGIDARGYMVIHCLYVFARMTRRGYGESLLTHVINESQGMYGIAVVTSTKPWVNDKRFFTAHGFKKVAEAPPYFELHVLKLKDGNLPSFREGLNDKTNHYRNGITVIYAEQCPAVDFALTSITRAVEELRMELKMIPVDNYSTAQAGPSPYGTFIIMKDGKFLTHRIYDKDGYVRILSARSK